MNSDNHLDADALIDQCSIGVMVCNRSGAIMRANGAACELIGAPTAGDLVGLPIYALRKEGDADAEQRYRDIAAKGKTDRIRYSGVTRFGRQIHCDLTVSPVKNCEGALCAWLVVITDMSEAVLLEHTLFQREHLSALASIIAGVAHELNNPLTGVLGYAQVLLLSDIPAAMRMKLDRIIEESSRCQRIVQNLLHFSRQADVSKRMCNINEFLGQVVSLREYQLNADKVNVHLDLDPLIPPFLGASYPLQSVFLNMINNAQQAIVEAGSSRRDLFVSSKREGNQIRIVIRDTGPGIPEEIQSRIFDPFFTTKKFGEGTGLGLSVAYGIVRDHDGEIYLDSRPGDGTTFTVVLPIRTENGAK